MAESIVIYFVEADWESLRRFLDQAACPVETGGWLYPNGEQPLVYVYEYDSILDEYADEDLDRLFGPLKGFPASSLCIELRRSLGNRSVDGAVKLTVRLLEKFAGVVDDAFSELWTLEEIENLIEKKNSRFLDVYKVTEKRR